MAFSFGVILLCQLVGEVFVRALGLAFPGPVLGLALFLLLLRFWTSLADRMRPTTSVLLANLSLLFVPAGVGIMANLELISGDMLAVFLVLLLSTILAMLASVSTFLAVSALMRGAQK